MNNHIKYFFILFVCSMVFLFDFFILLWSYFIRAVVVFLGLVFIHWLLT